MKFCIFYIPFAILLFYANSSSVFYVNQESTVDPDIADGSWSFPFIDIGSSLMSNRNITDFVIYLVNTDSSYEFPDNLPDNSQISIQTMYLNFFFFY